jgi:hypothetical protein
MGLGNLDFPDPLDDTDEEDFEQIDKQAIKEMISQHPEIPHISRTAPCRWAQIVDIVRWTIAFDDGHSIQTRRIEAQKRVAADRGIELPAVQEKVRKVYDGRYGRESAQDLFTNALEDIDERYRNQLENR